MIILTIKPSIFAAPLVNIPKFIICGGVYLPIFGIEPDKLTAIKIKNEIKVAGVMLFDITLENKTIVRIKTKYKNKNPEKIITLLICIILSSNNIFV